ncbi:AAA family ATPase [Streptomyces niveus]|uniref:AAA family ATPase n=1 Tax=Streptomyces niveus TaxID=193462 RepID=UPI0033D51368
MDPMDQTPIGKPRQGLEPFPRLIKSIILTRLFGQFDYSIDFLDTGAGKGEQDSPGRRLTLLYGDNGSGKTTILNLLWNTLSASPVGSHRSYIGNCPFASLTIRLTDGDVITIKKKDEDLQGPFTITVEGQGVSLVQSYVPVGDGGFMAVGDDGMAISDVTRIEMEMRIKGDHLARRRMSRSAVLRRQREQLALFADTRTDSFVDYLERVDANPYFLADDRQIYGDDIRHALNRHEAEEEGPNGTKSFLGKELGLAMRRVHHQLQRQAIDGNQKGSSGTNKIYLDLLARITQKEFTTEGATPVPQLLERLNRVAVRTQKYSEFGLMPALRSQPFASILQDLPPGRAAMAEEIISPYLEAQEARLDALHETEKLIRTFVEQVNGFLQTKRLVFELGRGMRVLSFEGHEQELSTHQLSSGERQILLLLSNTILARGNTRVFLIDEPELSLNVKWQRKLMSALLACTEDSGMQFVVATHSVEVITGNKDSLSRLVSQ